jgi:hypothetical protein
MKDTDAGAATVDQVEDGSPVQSRRWKSGTEHHDHLHTGKQSGDRAIPSESKTRTTKGTSRDHHQQRWNGGKTNLPALSRQGAHGSDVASITDEGSQKREQKFDLMLDRAVGRRQNLI